MHQASVPTGYVSVQHYPEDSHAETDMNVIMNEAGNFIEIQGTAEGQAFSHTEMNQMLQLADKGIKDIIEIQNKALHT